MSDVPDQSGSSNSEQPPKGKKPAFLHIAFVVCESFILDQLTQQRSLIGMISSIWAPSFPAVHAKLAIYAEITNGHGTYEWGVKLVYANDDEELFSASAPVVFSDPRMVVNLAFTLNNVIFPRPGEYRFQLLSDGIIVVERRVVLRERKQQEEPES